VSDQFIEGTTDDAYDFRGNRNPESKEWADRAEALIDENPLGLPPQDHAALKDASHRIAEAVVDRIAQAREPASESSGYKGPGGNTRNAIRARIEARVPYVAKHVHVEEWESDFEVRSMTLGDRNQIMEALMPEQGEAKVSIATMYPQIVAASVFDEEGEHVFTADDQGWLNSLPASIIDKLAKPALELSGFADAAVDSEAKKSESAETSD
jgi:hypothetical protein